MKTSFPYLVDISITEACPFGCEFCYTSSTKAGKHAEPYTLSYLADSLAGANTFEVVFGGGEPTLHPHISRIVHAFKSRKFSVGITTRNYNWHKLNTFASTIANVDSLAISVNSVADCEAARELVEAINAAPGGCRVYFQNILQLTSWDKFNEFLNHCKYNYYRVTLLGYKDFGFGKNQKPYDLPDDWIEQIKSKNMRTLGVDSIIAQKHGADLIAAGVADKYLVGKEGESTCYIDAVKQIMKPSSFTEESFNIKEAFNYKGDQVILDTFAKF